MITAASDRPYDALNPVAMLVRASPFDIEDSAARSETIQRLAAQIREEDIRASELDGLEVGNATIAEFQAMLRAMHPETLECLRQHMTDDDESTFISDLIFDVRASELALREALTFRNAFDIDWEPNLVLPFVKGLHCYDIFAGHPDLSKLDGITLETARSLCIVAAMIRYSSEVSGNTAADKKGLFISNEQLLQVVLDHPERGADIASFIDERRTTDQHLLRQYLTSPSPALSEGVL